MADHVTIWKFPFAVNDVVRLGIPRDARILTVQEQAGQPCLWALVNPAAPTMVRTFRIVGTGHPFPDADAHAYIGTFQLHDGRLVLHLFERIEVPRGE